MRPLDGFAVELGERHERHDPTAVHIRAGDLYRVVGCLLLDDLEQPLGAGGPNRDHHDAASRELLQQRRGNVVDAAGDDDLVEGSRLLPAVVAIGILAGDRLVLGVAARDESVVDAARALRKRLDDLDGPHLVGEIGEISRLIARARADFEHLLAHLDVDGRGHAADDVRAGDGHAEADIEVGVIVGAPLVVLERELLARGQEEGALVAVIEHVAVGNQRLVAAEALPEKVRVLASVGHHPFHESVAAGGWRHRLPAVGLRYGPGERRKRRLARGGGRGEQESPTSQALVPFPLAGITPAPSRIFRQSRATPMAALWRPNHANKKANAESRRMRPCETHGALVIGGVVMDPHEHIPVDELSRRGLQPLARLGKQDPRRHGRPEAGVRRRPRSRRGGLCLRLPSSRAALGTPWLERGQMQCRFLKPVYDGRIALVSAAQSAAGLDLEVHSEGVLCATGHASLGDGSARPPSIEEFEPRTPPPPSERPPASQSSLAEGTRLGIAPMQMTAEYAAGYLRDVRETDTLYTRECLAHPGALLRLCNLALRENVVLPPWIHTGSKVANFAAARIGDELSVRARVAANYERKGHRLVDLDALVIANGRTVISRVLHTAVYQLRQLA